MHRLIMNMILSFNKYLTKGCIKKNTFSFLSVLIVHGHFYKINDLNNKTPKGQLTGIS